MANEGYKIDVSMYEFKYKLEALKDGQFQLDERTGEPKLEDKISEVCPTIHLPLMLCNPQLGGNGGQTDPEFDLMELGTIAKLIEKADHFVVLDQRKFDTLKARVKKIQKHLNYKYFEMVRRIHEAEKVELEAKG